ncbi:MAG: MGMT family protein [Planctomycetota bacterium]
MPTAAMTTERAVIPFDRVDVARSDQIAHDVTLTVEIGLFGSIALTFNRISHTLRYVRWPEVNGPEGTPGIPLIEDRTRRVPEVPTSIFETAIEIARGIRAWCAQDFASADAAFRNAGSTPAGPRFYHACWEACRQIPAGEVITYGELAKRAGGEPRRHARPAGQAMRNNPWPLIIPCHRVIGSARDLHGYGGATDVDGSRLTTKRDLLVHEGFEVSESGRVLSA